MSYNCEHGVIGGDEYSCQECAKRDSAELATLRRQLAEAEKARDADKEIIADLVTGMDSWAAEEDHEIYADAWPAYCDARARLVWEFVDQKPSGKPPLAPKRKQLQAALATAEADCAAMREALDLAYVLRTEYVKDRTSQKTILALRALESPLRAALQRPTGQSILDELSAARKLLDRARQLAVQSCAIEGDEWGTLAANIDAARKANTGDK